MSDMRTITALGEAKKLVKFFEVFEKLEEVLKAVVVAEQSLPRLKKERDGLLADIEGLRQAKAKSSNDFKAFKMEKESQASAIAKSHTARMSAISSETKKAKAEQTASIEHLKVAYDGQAKTNASALTKARAEQIATQKKITVLRSHLEQLMKNLVNA